MPRAVRGIFVAKARVWQTTDISSDDSSKANLISRFQSSLERQGVYRQNIGVAKTRLVSEESALTSIGSVSASIEIAILAANGTMVAEDRAVLGAEIGS